MASTTSSRSFIALISVFNFLILSLAITIILCSLGPIGHWYDYATAAIALVIVLSWVCMSCTNNNVLVVSYTIIMIINMLAFLACGIIHTVLLKRYDNFCFDNYQDEISPEGGCFDWREENKAYTIAIVVCDFLCFLFQLINIGLSCLLARSLYDGEN